MKVRPIEVPSGFINVAALLYLGGLFLVVFMMTISPTVFMNAIAADPASQADFKTG